VPRRTRCAATDAARATISSNGCMSDLVGDPRFPDRASYNNVVAMPDDSPLPGSGCSARITAQNSPRRSAGRVRAPFASYNAVAAMTNYRAHLSSGGAPRRTAFYRRRSRPRLMPRPKAATSMDLNRRSATAAVLPLPSVRGTGLSLHGCRTRLDRA
jgi:hypothetical protein